MQKPTLVIMAAGMGSRYGGLKQIDPVDPQGHIIMDFSIYDAVRAGFGRVVFIIKRENEADFRGAIGDRVSRHVPVEYVFQSLDALPEGFSVPEGRTKPWGTGHALLSCDEVVDGPFAVINADDFYGCEAFEKLGAFLAAGGGGEKYHCAMVGYALKNTLTENGSVSRGLCEIGPGGRLSGIRERTRIEKRGDGAAFTEDDGRTWTPLSPDSVVSMNMWGFPAGILKELRERFPAFLAENLPKNPQKCEYFLPMVVNDLLHEGAAAVDVLASKDRWYGVTYREDKALVERAVCMMKEKGIYPEFLWGGNNCKQ